MYQVKHDRHLLPLEWKTQNLCQPGQKTQEISAGPCGPGVMVVALNLSGFSWRGVFWGLRPGGESVWWLRNGDLKALAGKEMGQLTSMHLSS